MPLRDNLFRGNIRAKNGEVVKKRHYVDRFIKERMVPLFLYIQSLKFYIVERIHGIRYIVSNSATGVPRKSFYIVQDCHIIDR